MVGASPNPVYGSVVTTSVTGIAGATVSILDSSANPVATVSSFLRQLGTIFCLNSFEPRVSLIQGFLYDVGSAFLASGKS